MSFSLDRHFDLHCSDLSVIGFNFSGFVHLDLLADVSKFWFRFFNWVFARDDECGEMLMI